jgi:hypothetical protein
MNVSETHQKQSGTTLKLIWPSVEHRFAGEVAEEEWLR